MLTIQIASDLHIEYKNNRKHNPWDYITPSADILVLAGDIGSLYKFNQLQSFLEILCRGFKYVLYIPGNQEYYIANFYRPLATESLSKRLIELENQIDNLYVLNRSSIIIEDVCFIGCTLWSKPTIEIPKFLVRIYDITTELYENNHKNDLDYICKMIDFSQKNNKKAVVLTHYCPTYKVLEAFHKREKYVSLYVSHLDDLLSKDKVHTWVCGHIHRNFDFTTEEGTRVVGNQRGKPKDNITDYKTDFVIIV